MMIDDQLTKQLLLSLVLFFYKFVLFNNLFCLIVPSLSSCHKKATMVLYFAQIHTHLGVVHF